MKTLSIQQPWASLVCAGIKDVENRMWKTDQTPGRILIHANSKKVTKNFFEGVPPYLSTIINNEIAFGNFPELETLPTSAIIGYVTVTSFEDSAMDSVWADGPGVIKWKLEDAWLFDEPILNVKGKQNLFDYDEIDENNLPPAHQVELEDVDINDAEDEVYIPCEKKTFEHIKTGKLNEISLFLTRYLENVFCVEDDYVLKPFKRVAVGCGKEYMLFELKDESCVFSLPNPRDETKPIVIYYPDGSEGTLMVVQLVFGKKLDEGELIELDGDNIIHELNFESNVKPALNKDVIKFTVCKSVFNDIVNGQLKVFTKEIRPKTQSLYCIMDEDGYVKEINGVMQLRKYDAIQFVCKNDSYTCEIINADLELLEDQNGNQITYEKNGEEYLAAQIVYTLGDEII